MKHTMSNVSESYVRFVIDRYSLQFRDEYNPACALAPATSEFCRVVLNCYYIALCYVRSETWEGRNTALPYMFKTITREGAPGVRPNVLFAPGTALLQFVKNNHNEFFVVDVREFLSILCFICMQLPNVRSAHPEVTFLFEECMVNQPVPLMPAADRPLTWPFSRYFAVARPNCMLVEHRFSFYTLMYLCTFCISEMGRRNDPALFHRTTIDFQHANFTVATVDDAVACNDFDVIADNLSCSRPDAYVDPGTVAKMMRHIIEEALRPRFPLHSASNDTVSFIQYAATPSGDLVSVVVPNAFAHVVFDNMCRIVCKTFPTVSIERVNERFVMRKAALKLVHLTSIGLCSIQRSRWFSGILPMYPLVARVYIDATNAVHGGSATEEDALVVWCATVAWLNVLFGKQERWTTRLKSAPELMRTIAHCASTNFTLIDLLAPTCILDTSINGASHYHHSKVRFFPLYDTAPDADHPLLRSSFAIEHAMCTSCRSGKCAEQKMCAPAPDFFSFVLTEGCGQEEGSPINPRPTTANSMMVLLINKCTKSNAALKINFCSAFATAFYPYLARFEILPPSWNMTL